MDGYITETGTGRNVFVATSLLDMYTKCGMEKARCVFDGMPEKDTVSRGNMIQEYASMGFLKRQYTSSFKCSSHGRRSFCLCKFRSARIRGLASNLMRVLCVCCDAGLVDDGRRYFNNTTSVFSLTPTIEHYGCMVELLGCTCLLNEAYELIKSMSVGANCSVWGAWVDAGYIGIHNWLNLYQNKSLS